MAGYLTNRFLIMSNDIDSKEYAEEWAHMSFVRIIDMSAM